MISLYNYAVILPVRRETAVLLIKLQKRGSMAKSIFWKGVFNIFSFQEIRTRKGVETTISVGYQVTIHSKVIATHSLFNFRR